MQFSYNETDNWKHTLDFGTDYLVHFKSSEFPLGIFESQAVHKYNWLTYFNKVNLDINNFPGLEDYLKKNYPEVLPSAPITERELISQLVEMLDHFIEGDDNIDFDAYKKAKLYLDPNYDESEDFFV